MEKVRRKLTIFMVKLIKLTDGGRYSVLNFVEIFNICLTSSVRREVPNMKIKSLKRILLIICVMISSGANAEEVNDLYHRSIADSISHIFDGEKSFIGSINLYSLQKLSGFQYVNKFPQMTLENGKKIFQGLQNQDLESNLILGTLPVFNESLKDPTKIFSNQTLDKLPFKPPGPQTTCLAEAVYFEARGEGLAGQAAVAEVILNRVASKKFPSTVCKVINQGSSRKFKCQFSYMCDGKSEKIYDRNSYERIVKLSWIMIMGSARVLTNGATYYHATAVSPTWAKSMEKTNVIGRHIFYRPKSG